MNNYEQATQEVRDAFRALCKGRVEAAVEAEREAIRDAFWMSLQSDLENGVKSLNEKAAAEYHKNYPGLVGFSKWLNERGQA